MVQVRSEAFKYAGGLDPYTSSCMDPGTALAIRLLQKR